MLSKDGKAYDRIIGFEDLGAKDDFPTLNLARKLVLAKIITAKNRAEKGEINISKGKDNNDSDEYDI